MSDVTRFGSTICLMTKAIKTFKSHRPSTLMLFDKSQTSYRCHCLCQVMELLWVQLFINQSPFLTLHVVWPTSWPCKSIESSKCTKNFSIKIFSMPSHNQLNHAFIATPNAQIKSLVAQNSELSRNANTFVIDLSAFSFMLLLIRRPLMKKLFSRNFFSTIFLSL